jgi:hypothetical protein
MSAVGSRASASVSQPTSRAVTSASMVPALERPPKTVRGCPCEVDAPPLRDREGRPRSTTLPAVSASKVNELGRAQQGSPPRDLSLTTWEQPNRAEHPPTDGARGVFWAAP